MDSLHSLPPKSTSSSPSPSSSSTSSAQCIYHTLAISSLLRNDLGNYCLGWNGVMAWIINFAAHFTLRICVGCSSWEWHYEYVPVSIQYTRQKHFYSTKSLAAAGCVRIIPHSRNRALGSAGENSGVEGPACARLLPLRVQCKGTLTSSS